MATCVWLLLNATLFLFLVLTMHTTQRAEDRKKEQELQEVLHWSAFVYNWKWNWLMFFAQELQMTEDGMELLNKDLVP